MTLTIPPPVHRAEALEARELGLLAHAVGDHLPYELVLRVQALRTERVALVAGLARDPVAAGLRLVC